MKLYFNYQYNSTSDLWEALKKPETVGRGKVILKGTVFSCVFEAPSTPAQLFTDSNIYMNTLTEEFASLKDRANCVEVSFLNKDKNYDRDVVAVYGSSWNDSADNSTQITLDGCTEYEQAYRHGYHLLKQTECFVRTMEFTADVDAIACQVGDSILFQHSLLKYGLTRGRTNSLITLNSMTFNEDVILKPDTDYVVMFRLMDDTFVEKHIQAVSELTQTNIVRFTSPFTTVPPEGCLFACGEVGKVVKPLKVVNISRSSGNLKRKITALEFSDDLYNEASSIPKIDYTTSNVTLASFTAEEDGYSQSDGTHISEIDVKYKLFNPNKELLKVQILVQKDEGDWEAFKVSSSQEASLTLSNVRVGSTYAFRLRVYSYMGIPLTGWITSNTVTVTGKKDSDPTDITSIVAAQRNDSIVIDGVIVKDVDFAGIEIRVDGDTWSRAQKINTLFTDFPITINGVFDGTHIIRAKSVDNIGNRSMNDATYIINVTGVNHYKNIVLERNDVDSLGSLTLSNLVIAGNTLIAPSGITYGDYSTYGDLPLPYYVQAVTGSLTASLISQPIDTYKVGRTGINFDFGWSISDVNATYGTIGDRTYGDYIQDTYGNVTTEGNVNIYISFCDDLVNGTWTDWQMYLGGEYIFRYIKYKVDIEWESVNTKPVLSKLKQYYDVPDVTLSKVVEVPVDGLTINFNAEGLDFYFTPSSITTTVINGNGNVFPEVTAVSAESITIKCYNKLGESVIGNILVVCKGY
jgi:hypothetical protein